MGLPDIPLLEDKSNTRHSWEAKINVWYLFSGITLIFLSLSFFFFWVEEIFFIIINL